MRELIINFLINEVNDLIEEGSMCLDCCEEEDNYHMVTYWIPGSYDVVYNFIKKNNNEKMFDEIIKMYSEKKDIEKLKEKIKGVQVQGNYKAYIAYEALASILLCDYQKEAIWYTVYGSEEDDMIDFKKYHIMNALHDDEEFPVMKSEDVVAAMLGVNAMVQPSDLYDVFAYRGPEYIKREKTLLDTEDEKIFTPDPFQYEGVCSRYKNYTDMIGNSRYAFDYVETYMKGEEISELVSQYKDITYNMVFAQYLAETIREDYMEKFNKPPLSLPLLDKNIEAGVILQDEPLINIKFSIRGVQDCKSLWKEVSNETYKIPMATEFKNLMIKIAKDIRKNLAGLEAEKKTKDHEYIPAVEGKYPRKYSLSHGLTLIDNLNVQYKDKRGLPCNKPAIARFPLSLAEKQATYYVKKMLRYSDKPFVSCSFGIDSMVVMHIVRKVSKEAFKILFSNSKIEYEETLELRDLLIDKWGIGDQLIETSPIKQFFPIMKNLGWNFQRKGSRKMHNGNKKNVSEECCRLIKHEPTKNAIKQHKWDCDISGLRADESLSRELAIKRDGVVYMTKSWGLIRLNPIVFFTQALKESYVKKYNVPYSKIYDMKVYYEDVFDNVPDEERGKVYYQPRTGCKYCMLSMKYGYLSWLKKFKPRDYWFMMKNMGLAKELYSMAMGLENEKDNENKKLVQLSMLDNPEEDKKNIGDLDIDNLDVNQLEYAISRRPCMFQQVS